MKFDEQKHSCEPQWTWNHLQFVYIQYVSLWYQLITKFLKGLQTSKMTNMNQDKLCWTWTSQTTRTWTSSHLGVCMDTHMTWNVQCISESWRNLPPLLPFKLCKFKCHQQNCKQNPKSNPSWSVNAWNHHATQTLRIRN
jgi:hypothetical protein